MSTKEITLRDHVTSVVTSLGIVLLVRILKKASIIPKKPSEARTLLGISSGYYWLAFAAPAPLSCLCLTGAVLSVACAEKAFDD